MKNFRESTLFITLIDFPIDTKGGSIKYALLLNEGLRNNFYKTKKILFPKKIIKNKKFKYINLIYYIFEIIKSKFSSINKIFISHHPLSSFFLLCVGCKSCIYICHGPWGEEYLDISKYGIFRILNKKIRDQMQLFVLKKSSQVFFVSEYMSSYVIDALNDRSIKNKFFQLGPIIEEIKIKNHFAKVSRINGVVIRRLVKELEY